MIYSNSAKIGCITICLNLHLHFSVPSIFTLHLQLRHGDLPALHLRRLIVALVDCKNQVSLKV